jgi:acyl-CoA dehydrogenase
MQAASDTERSARDIECSEEQAMLGQNAAELLAQHCDLGSVRRAMESETGYDPALYRKLAELGWLGIAIPESHGGAGLSPGVLCAVAEPIGRHLLASPFLSTTLAAQLLLHAGSEAQKQTWLSRLVHGEATGSVALSEPGGSYALRAFGASASRTAKGLELRGTKSFVLDAAHADFAIAAVTLDGSPALVLIERPALAGRTRREVLIDETRRSYRLTLDGLTLPPEALLTAHPDPQDATPQGATAALDHVERVAWLLLAAEMAGGADGVVELTLDYLRTRTQFGKPIGSYQALKHPMVEIACALEQGRSLLYHAATAFGRPEPGREIALRMAKAKLGDTFTHAADRAIQFHGAIGFTYECHAQLFFRRAQWAQFTFGDSAHHHRKLAQLLWP